MFCLFAQQQTLAVNIIFCIYHISSFKMQLFVQVQYCKGGLRTSCTSCFMTKCILFFTESESILHKKITNTFQPFILFQINAFQRYFFTNWQLFHVFKTNTVHFVQNQSAFPNLKKHSSACLTIPKTRLTRQDGPATKFWPCTVIMLSSQPFSSYIRSQAHFLHVQPGLD